MSDKNSNKELIIIAAVAQNRVIGNKGKIPWHFSEDLTRFRRLTLNCPVIMGRKTYESILERLGKPLDRRTSIVLTHRVDVEAPGLEEVLLCSNIDKAVETAHKLNHKIYVIGGQSVYEQTIDMANKMELTEIHREYEGDAFFPEFNVLKEEWAEKSRSLMYGYEWVSYVSYERK